MSERNSQIIKLNTELNHRREKLRILRKKEIVFPNDFRRDTRSDLLHINYDNKSNHDLTELNISVSIAGRMVTRRIIGKSSFVTLQDGGGRIQLYISTNNFSENFYNNDFKKWDLGDILGAKGNLFKTKTGELSINCYEIRLLVKSIRPLPDKFHGLIDQETRYRQRYLDLISNDISLHNFRLRSKIISAIRKFMVSYDFLEVETPILQTIPGGALAKPFVTHHNSLNINMYLRVSPELYLKRLIIGGFERVFEISRNFRNEGMSTRHNPEFTMMELYMAYADYKDLMILTENLFLKLAKQITGKTKIICGDQIICFNKPFKKLTMKEAICNSNLLINISDLDDIEKTKNIADKFNILIEDNWSLGHIITKIFEEIVEKKLIQPTFITEYPVEISPLARCNDHNSSVTDRFELFINGCEIGNGFSELNDPEEQKTRFISQIQNKDLESNNDEFFDEDYIIALEHGLPPTAGIGIGIDRLVMLFTNQNNIRDVILFPTMRPISIK